MTAPFRPTIPSLATAYADQGASGDNAELVIPAAEELAALDDAAIASLASDAQETFDALYGDGTGLTDSEMDTLRSLTEGIESLARVQTERAEAAAEREREAAELAARIRPADAPAEDAAEEDADDAEDTEDAEDEPAAEDSADEDVEEAVDEGAAQAIAASSGPVRVPLSSVRSRAAQREAAQRAAREDAPAVGVRDVMTMAGDGLGFANGAGIDFLDAGTALDRRLQSFNAAQYTSAARDGRHMREQHSLLSIRRPIPDNLVIDRPQDVEHVEAVVASAVNETALPGGSLVAAGGWCAPSEQLYGDLLELESRDGLLSIPEVGARRGGVIFTTGPSFQSIYDDVKGFSYTEAQDVEGEYGVDANGVGNDTEGSKPCYTVECPTWEEVRLGIDGLCITSGLLQQRGYPEMLQRVIRGALVAHEHRLNGRMIAKMVADSTAVTMPSVQAGAAAPILTSIELQVEHYRYAHRTPRSATLEAVFPFWVRGVVRADLARRTGMDLLAVTDAQINAWFTSRGISPQFVYNWQPITGASGSFTEWPSTVSFLLYAAGTFVRLASEIITMDTIYDSTQLSTNDFTALFTEEGWNVAKRGHDSRVVTVEYAADGSTRHAVDIEHDGTFSPIADEGGAG